MKWKQVWLIFLLCFNFAANAQSDKQALLQQACRQFDSALIAKDTVTLKFLLLDDFRMKHSNGLIETKEELLEHLSRGFLKYDEIVQEGAIKDDYEEELGFVNRNLKVGGWLNGSSFNVKLKTSEIWIWNDTDKRWQLKRRKSIKAQ